MPTVGCTDPSTEGEQMSQDSTSRYVRDYHARLAQWQSAFLVRTRPRVQSPDLAPFTTE
jgi:hypothetical protein